MQLFLEKIWESFLRKIFEGWGWKLWGAFFWENTRNVSRAGFLGNFFREKFWGLRLERAGVFFSENIRNFFREKFWRLKPESALGCYKVYYFSLLLINKYINIIDCASSGHHVIFWLVIYQNLKAKKSV